MKVKTLLILLLGLSFADTATGEYRSVCPTAVVEAEEGDAVFLPCHLEPPINLSAYTVDWKRADVKGVVHSHRRGQENPYDQMKQYRHRTSLNHEDLSRGNMTLLISSAQMSDGGRYKCFVPKLRSSCTVDLILVRQGQRNRTKRGNFTTAERPHEEPGSPGGETFTVVLAVVLPAVLLLILGFICRKKIQSCWRKQQGDPGNGHELGRLRSPLSPPLKDVEGAAANGLGEKQ
ncbi:hypothetical protein Q5P01_025688 [Channa striata]|uniref:Ig-like domain-containing protein n=1 Tax=Channa striata TaxID=64152 RepID=A0AA88IIZ4_CHASR|nr:hypothetical protein Q5P01_025688 [Channa striata]